MYYLNYSFAPIPLKVPSGNTTMSLPFLSRYDTTTVVLPPIIETFISLFVFGTISKSNFLPLESNTLILPNSTDKTFQFEKFFHEIISFN